MEPTARAALAQATAAKPATQTAAQVPLTAWILKTR